MSVRIGGLVKAERRVRAALADLTAADARAKVFREAFHVVAQVDRICAQNATTPDDLPSCYRSAYDFLRRVVAQQPSSPDQVGLITAPRGPGADQVIVPDVGPRVRQLDFIFWRRLDELDGEGEVRSEVRAEIRRQRDTIERSLEDRGLPPARLTGVARRVYHWLAFLSEGSNFQSHLDSLKRARAILSFPDRDPGMRCSVSITPQAEDWAIRADPLPVHLAAHPAFTLASTATWEALISASFLGDDEATEGVRAFLATPTAVALRARVDPADEATPTPDTEG